VINAVGRRRVVRTLVIVALTLLVALPAAQADLELSGKIPGPGTPPGCSFGVIEGLGTIHELGGPDKLFVLVRCETTSHLYIMDPLDGEVLRYSKVAFSPPDCGSFYSQVSGGAHWYDDVYWLAEDCGNYIEVMWTADTLFVIDSFMTGTHDDPWGLTIRNDTLFAANSFYGELNHVDSTGLILAEYELPAAARPPGALTMYRGTLFGAARDVDSIFIEMDLEAAVVDTHLMMPASDRIYPRGATVLGGQLYVGGSPDSIYIFDFKTYNTPVAPATDETVSVVPGVVAIAFDSILDSGWVRVDISDSQACSPPGGVTFISDFYEITTTSRLEYVSEITIADSVPSGIDIDKLRIFSRPSGACGVFRDISVQAARVPPTLRIHARQKSEDDEFSFFASAIDERDPADIVDLKFTYLRGHIESGEDSIPQAVYSDITDLLTQAETRWTGGQPLVAATLVDSIAGVVSGVPSIPHVHDPADPGKNLAGRIISRAHTLSFSLRYYRSWLAGVEPRARPPEIRLAVHPNPAGTSVLIDLALSDSEPVDVSVYSVRGELVKRLYRGRPSDGRLSLEWKGNNTAGTPVSSGMYFISARQGAEIVSRKIVLQ
jgi:hypothetical protein